MSRPRAPSARHEAALPSGKTTTGFSRELRRRFGIGLGRQWFIPDAYEFDEATKTLTLYEVVVTHAVDDKLWKLRAVRDLLALTGWKLRLLVGDSNGAFEEVSIDTGLIDFDVLRAAVDRLPKL